MANPIIRIDKLAGATVESVINTSADMPQGSAVNLGALASGERDVYTVSTPATDTLASAEVLIVASPEVMYEAGKGLADFTNVKGKVARAYHTPVGFTFTITDDGIDGTTAVGKYLVPKNGSLKLTVADDLTGNTRFAAIIIEKGTLGWAGGAATTARVIKC